VPYVLQEAKGYAAARAGAALLPLPLVLTLASPVVGALAGRIDPRRLLTLGPCIVAGGFLLAGLAPADASYWTSMAPQLLIISVGMSLAVAPLTTAVLSSVAPTHAGTASGFNSAVARTGGLIATALMSVVLAARGGALISDYRAACLVASACALAAAAAGFFGLKGEAGRRTT
jgi:MFS family permease